MIMNRNARRAIKRNAPLAAALVAATCLDYSNGRLQPITDPQAVRALQRAFTRMLAAGGRFMAFPISEAEAMGFPVRRDSPMPGAAHWLAVGVDVGGFVTWHLESAVSEDRAFAHDMARDRALDRVAAACAYAGYTAATGRYHSFYPE